MYEKYEHMRDSGLSPREVSSAGLADGMEMLENWKMLRSVFGLGLPQVKEVYIQACGIGGSLEEFQGDLLPEIDAALTELEASQNKLDSSESL